ncbi:MAG: VCBS repeat-containing protein [Deltaproteobacteria bacterium]|nr:VCBS repeat-containing protein [Deltaproteobacteria bacterium]
MNRAIVVLALVFAGCGARSGLSGGDAPADDAAVDGGADVALDGPPIVTEGCRSNGLGSPLRPAPAVDYRLVESMPLPDSASGVAIGDVTGDGRADVVGVSETGSWVLPQRADGGFGAPLRVGSGGHALALITLGGRPAFVVANRSALVTLRIGATGAIEVVNRTKAADPNELTVGDVDGDGLDDVVVSIRDSLRITTFFGDATGAFPRQDSVSFTGHDPRIAVQGVVLADIDSTPGLELAVLVNDPYLGVLHRSAAGAWDLARSTHASTPASYRALNVADMDGDGLIDLVVGVRTLELYGPGALVVRQQPSGGFAELPWAPSRRPRDTLAIAARDVDGDGQADFATVVRDEDGVNTALSLFFGRGSSRIAGPSVPLGREVDSSDVVVGDIDCDGCPDVIVDRARVFRGVGCGARR